MGRSARNALLVAVIGMLIASCSSQPEIYRAQASGDGITLHFEMNACHGDYAVTISEDVNEVRVSITDQRRRTPFSGGDDCSDAVGPIFLEQPLGDRRLVDSSHDVELPVLFTPWNQAKYSEVDYLAAVEAAAECVKSIDPEATVSIVAHPDGYPDLRVSPPDLGDGESRQTNPESVCVEQHIDPLRR
jgi:hypothetical protein